MWIRKPKQEFYFPDMALEANINCLKCKKEIDDEQHYTCDWCLGRIHKNCIRLTASEDKCKNSFCYSYMINVGSCWLDYHNMWNDWINGKWFLWIKAQKENVASKIPNFANITKTSANKEKPKVIVKPKGAHITRVLSRMSCRKK